MSKNKKDNKIAIKKINKSFKIMELKGFVKVREQLKLPSMEPGPNKL